MSQLEATTSAPVNNDAEDTREKKRIRTSEPEGELSSAIRSEKYWFDDGNVILHVENRLFRVHRGVLARHSSAFNVMIQVLQPDEKEQKETMIAGCQVARLPCDKAEDWERVFAVIYDLDGAYEFKEQGSIKPLVSLLRLGKKYRFEAILDDVMQQLRRIIPTTLEAWSGVPKQLRHSMIPLYELTQAVVEAGNETLLPTLFFLCAAFPEDGPGAILMLCREMGIPSSTLETLLDGRERIIAACSELQFTSLFGAGASDNNNQPTLCRRRPICQPARQNYYLKYIVLEPRVYLALKPGSEVINMSALANVCKGCKQDILAAQDVGRQVMWDRIPKFFDLPDWNDLEDS